MQNNNEMLTVAKAAEELGVHPTTVNRMFHDGAFPNAYRNNPTNKRSRLNIPIKDVDRLIQMREEEVQAAA